MSYTELPGASAIRRTVEAVQSRGVTVHLLETKEDALPLLVSLIPDGATVMMGASVTLEQVGFVDVLKSGNHKWHNLKAEVAAERDPVKQTWLRKQATLADYFLGSVHAIAETGEIVVASATGSQIAPYAYSSAHVIWVAGAQKITPTLDAALRRVREHSFVLEDQRMRKASGGSVGSTIAKVLIFEREGPLTRRSVTLLLVNEVLGY